jgi:hypothetical protein
MEIDVGGVGLKLSLDINMTIFDEVNIYAQKRCLILK